METIAGGKTPGLCLVEALPAEVVALGISIRDITRDGSWMVGHPEVNLKGRQVTIAAAQPQIGNDKSPSV
jgi:hypothetical protein